MSKLNIFVPLTKIDEENRLVYGVVAAEVVDNSGETFDYEKSKPYFQKWSMNAELTSNGLSKGNLREMHGKVAAGKLTDISFDDENKRIECCAKVVDDMAWKKCLEGVYTGFSMGGRYAEKWVEKIAGGEQKRYAGDPAEISLVDKPCIPTATFQLIKADGMVEEHHFSTVLDDEELEKADKKPYGDVNYADPGYQKDGKKRYPIDTEDHIRSAWSYINQEKNAGEYSADQLKKIKAKIEAAWRSKIDKAGPPSAEKADTGENLMKREYVPTNDELAARGMELAKAAGKPETEWLEFADDARASLIAEKADKADTDDGDKGTAAEGEDKGDFDDKGETGPKPGGDDDGTKPASGDDKKDAKEGDDKDAKKEGDDKDKKGKPFGKADGEEKEDAADDDDAAPTEEAAEKSDSGTGDAVEQGWRAKDGTFFLKKADALAHNDKLNKADGEPETLLGLVSELAKAVHGEDGEGAPAVEDEPEQPECIKYAEFIEGTVALLKAEDADGQELNKGMWSVERLARALREVGSLTISVSQEAKREGDNSELPGMLRVAVGQLGDTLVAMAKEEVDELMLMVAKDMGGGDQLTEVCVSDCYYELAASTLGLEKSDFDELAKAAGAKKSAHVQGIHDRMAKMGAKCSGLEKADADVMNKMDGEMAELRKRAESAEEQIKEAMPLIKTLMSDIEAIKKLPQASAPRTSVVEKGDDGKEVQQMRANSADDLLKMHSPQDLAMAAIRLGQQHGVTMTARGMVPHRQGS